MEAMREVAIFQTVANIGDPLERESLGPIFCKENPWLGQGYYFWDGILSNAEWWGKTHYKGDYMIFSSSYDAHSDELFDLVGNPNHIECLCTFANELKKQLGCKSLKVSFVLEMMKKEGLFPFSAIKAEGRNKLGVKNNFLYFDDQGIYYLQPIPKFQLCIIDFEHFHLADYKFLKASND